MDFIISILEQGLIYGILGLGVYITYKILDFPDLTTDGSFPLGAAVSAAMITRGVNPYLTLLASFLAGAIAGCCTGLIHVKCKVRDLLSGIIMMTALWTINLRIAGTSNVPLFSQESIFDNGFLEKIPEPVFFLPDASGDCDSGGSDENPSGSVSEYPLRISAESGGRQCHAGDISGQG